MRESPLRLPIAPSPLLAGVLLLAHGAAIACAVLCLPATAPVPTYSVRVEGDEIKVGWA